LPVRRSCKDRPSPQGRDASPRILRIFLGDGAFGAIRKRVYDLNIRPGQSVLDALNTVFRGFARSDSRRQNDFAALGQRAALSQFRRLRSGGNVVRADVTSALAFFRVRCPHRPKACWWRCGSEIRLVFQRQSD